MKSVCLHHHPHLSIHMQYTRQSNYNSRQTLIHETHIPFILKKYESLFNLSVNHKLAKIIIIYTYINKNNVMRLLNLIDEPQHLDMILNMTHNLFEWLKRISSLPTVKIDKNFYACKQMLKYILT